MNRTIISARYTKSAPQDFYRVFDLGVKTIEREFDTMIGYDVHFTGNEARLCLKDGTVLFPKDDSVAEAIEYKLSTLFTICLDHY